MKTVLITTSSFGKFDPSLLEELSKKKINHILNPYGRKLTEEEVGNLVNEHQPNGMIAGVEPLTAKVLKGAIHLKTIARCGIGMDSVDLQTAEQLGIKVTNTPDAPTIPVAELTLGMILSLLRKIHISDAAIRSAKWVRPMGNLLFDKTVGLIGCGRIGTCVGKMLSAFGCKVQGFDPFVKESTHIKLVDFDSVMSGSDIVSLHIPYTKDNHHILGRQAMGQMKKGSYVINASRGGLVDEAALCDLLVSGHLGGAALDCFEKEPYAGKLTGLDNVLLTGHIGSYAIEGRNMQERQALDNLLANL